LKKILILGGSGFIGSSIVDYGIEKKLIKSKINEIYILSRSERSKSKRYKHININYITKNIIDLKKIPEVDYIIYCLRNNDINISRTYFNKFVKLVEKNKKKPKILFTSSGAVYGKNTDKIKNQENKKINLNSINKLKGYKKKYAIEKIFIEKKFIKLSKNNYKVSIARCFTFIGKRILKYIFAISSLINDALKKKTIKLNTSENVYRSYMHSDDMVKWLITMLNNSNYKCPIYNLGSDRVINLRTLTKNISELVGKKPQIKKISSKKFDYYVPSIEKAKKKLKLRISINLKEAIDSIIKI